MREIKSVSGYAIGERIFTTISHRNQGSRTLPKTILICNPYSGTCHANLETFTSSGWASSHQLDVHVTKSPGDATRLSREACESGKVTIIVAGGDGTIGEVVNGLAGRFKDVRLGILSTGTGNDFARWLDIPLDLEGAIETILAEGTRWIDVIRVSSGDEVLRHFVNVAVSAVDQEGQHRIEAGFKNNWGLLGYLQAGFEAVTEIHPHKIELTIDETEIIKLVGSVIVVGNGGSMSAGIPVLPPAKVDDGQLDVAVFRPTTGAGLALLAPWVLSGTHLGGDQVLHRTAKRLTLRGEPPLSFSIDDHVFTSAQFTFEVIPKTLEVIVRESETAETGQGK
ncbi:MAG: diacylglycerol/lipid kinase family protein [Gemmataceae bacterium]